MKYLFWNTNKQKVNEYLKELIIKDRYGIVILAEYNDNLKELLEELDDHNILMYEISDINICERIRIISCIDKFQTGDSEEYYTIKIIKISEVEKQIISAVHLPSKMHAEDADRRVIIERMKNHIESIEEKYGTKNTIIVGDFNANPFEDCILNADGLHAVSSIEVASKESRIVKKFKYSFFYNPMWSKFGDFDKIPGTFYYKGESRMREEFWNICDEKQFIRILKFILSSTRVKNLIKGILGLSYKQKFTF
ncbi:exonuclease/endonuclease/phosphatase family protein [Clostridium hydrogenum]|uniref:hypothetical protein n=1 Tax=Clostridium hydrogenum TaxID=2855764 RepID=UPI001F2FC4CF|nr:hypothetical protein [Clostridium hydrogenum]